MKTQTVVELIEIIKSLPDEEKRKVLCSFCKDCLEFIGEDTDWSGSNYCFRCSPDPAE